MRPSETASAQAVDPSPRPFSPATREFLDTTRWATIATVDPDGTLRQAVVWYTVDGDEIIVNSAVGRHWPSNLVRDPRVSLSVASDDGYHWVSVTGTAVPVADQATAQADIAAMARRYHADDPDKAERLIRGSFERQQRISFRVRATRIVDYVD
jgi:PPOX class probable F420-dependent enzyme